MAVLLLFDFEVSADHEGIATVPKCAKTYLKRATVSKCQQSKRFQKFFSSTLAEWSIKMSSPHFSSYFDVCDGLRANRIVVKESFLVFVFRCAYFYAQRLAILRC